MGAPARAIVADAAGRRRFRIRTLTAGVTLQGPDDVATVQRAVEALQRCRTRFEGAGYDVQTLRVATNPIAAATGPGRRRRSLALLAMLDLTVGEQQVMLSIGPVLVEDRSDLDLAGWAADLVSATRRISFSVVVASAAGGIHRHAAREAAAVITRLARTGDDGTSNFRFAAAARIDAGTPFFPVAWHDGDATLALGLESATLVHDAFETAADPTSAESRLRALLDAELRPLVPIAEACARDEHWRFAGIDPSPAPGIESSIGGAIEALTRVPFGGTGTLDACSTVTAALRTLSVPTCGYAGLMLPVLEDPGLAVRAGEGRYGIKDLLLFSSVCGTGLDVVPLPGEVAPEAIARLVTDVAALSVRLRKPLSARLFPMPGKAAGDRVSFDSPLLTPCVVFPLE